MMLQKYKVRGAMNMSELFKLITLNYVYIIFIFYRGSTSDTYNFSSKAPKLLLSNKAFDPESLEREKVAAILAAK